MTTPVKSEPRSDRYNPSSFEQKWRDAWNEAELYKWDPAGEPKWYQITMYPYPSGDLHIGHWYAMSPADAAARYKRMLGYNVFFPMGFDAFGLPAENAAIRNNIHPYKWTLANIENMRAQMRSMGTMFDWDQEVVTCDPEYYKWNQWFFLKFYEQDIAYRAKAPVWWCPNDNTVLANEQVIDGRCERCDAIVYRRDLEQWFFRITDYADELLDFSGIEWPDPIRIMQTNWIGRSEGATVTFTAETGDPIEVFTTRPDTLWGATFMVLAPEHPLVDALTSEAQRAEVDAYIEQTSRETEIERQSTVREKSGVFTGGYATNPVNGEQVPVWIADYVLMTYGTGAIMAVPAHDERDFEFAIKFGLPIIPVIERLDGITKSVAMYASLEDDQAFRVALEEEEYDYEQGSYAYEVRLDRDNTDAYLAMAGKYLADNASISYAGTKTGLIFEDRVIELDSAIADQTIMDRIPSEMRTTMEIIDNVPFYGDIHFHTDYGAMINSGELSGTAASEAVEQTIAYLEANGIGRREVTYRMRDWLISRQRYWGTPIPIIYCDECGVVPVPLEDLPVVLPEDSEFQPTGESPLKTDERFINTTCPECGGPAKRETDTMDTFVDSSWYQFRYLSPHDDQMPFDMDLTERWQPVDYYTGGREHAVMHLLYTRFFTRALRDMGMVNFSEPLLRLKNQGFILGEDSQKMSKSRGNVIDPDDLVEEMGADAVRLFLMFMRPWDQGGPWDPQGISGVRRFLDRVFTIVVETLDNPAEHIENDTTRQLRRITHQTIQSVTEDLDTYSFNTMVARLMEFVNELMKLKETPTASTAAWREAIETLPLLLAPSAPHIAEELWHRLGNDFSVHLQSWPAWDPEIAAEETMQIVVQVNGKVRGHIDIPADADEGAALSAARANDNAASHLEGQTIVKEIYVPGRLVNFVVR